MKRIVKILGFLTMSSVYLMQVPGTNGCLVHQDGGYSLVPSVYQLGIAALNLFGVQV